MRETHSVHDGGGGGLWQVIYKARGMKRGPRPSFIPGDHIYDYLILDRFKGSNQSYPFLPWGARGRPPHATARYGASKISVQHATFWNLHACRSLLGLSMRSEILRRCMFVNYILILYIKETQITLSS